MDPISKFLASYKIPIGPWGKAFFDFLTDNFNVFFRGLSNGLNFLLDGLVDGLLLVPPVLLAALIALLAWYLQRSRELALGVSIGLLFIINQNLWKQTVRDAGAGRRRRRRLDGRSACRSASGRRTSRSVYRIMLPVLDLMQTLPTFVYLIPVLTLFGLGNAPGLIVTIIFVIPTAGAAHPSRHHLGARRRSSRPARSFGATKRQLLWKVELPAALPTIMAGPDAVHHAVAVDGGVRRPDRRRRPRHRDQPGARLAQDRPRAGGRPRHRRAGHRARPHDPHRRGRQEMNVAVEFKNVDIVFGTDTRRGAGA